MHESFLLLLLSPHFGFTLWPDELKKTQVKFNLDKNKTNGVCTIYVAMFVSECRVVF